MRNKKGFTLVELLVAIAIFSLVITLAGTFLVSGLRNYETVTEVLTGQANTRYVMYDISKTLRNASVSDITINESNTAITIDDVTYSYSSENGTISRTISENIIIIAREIIDFDVSLTDETVSYAIFSSNDSSHLTSSVTLKVFDRPSPP